MAIGDLHTEPGSCGDVRWLLTFEELAGHDPDNDAQALQIVSPVMVAGAGFVNVTIRDFDTDAEIWTGDFDVAVVEGEWDEWRLRPPQLAVIRSGRLDVTLRPDPTGQPHRPRQPGQTGNAPGG